MKWKEREGGETERTRETERERKRGRERKEAGGREIVGDTARCRWEYRKMYTEQRDHNGSSTTIEFRR